MAKAKELSPGAVRALELLRNYDGEPTLAQLNEGLDEPVHSGTLTGLVRNGLVESYEVEVEGITVAKLKAYSLTGAEPTEEMKLTEGMTAAYEALGQLEGPQTMANINEVASMTVYAAHLTGLVRHGLAESVDVEVERPQVRKVKAYRLV